MTRHRISTPHSLSGIYRVSRSSGFTLFELLITVALASIVLASAYGILRAGLVTQRDVEYRADVIQSGRVALDWMSRDLRSAVALSENMEFVGMSRMIETVEADNLDFATRYGKPTLPGESDFKEVSYFLRSNERVGGLSLCRRVDPTLDEEPLSGGRIEELIRHVAGLKFEYYDGLEWFDDWGSSEPLDLETIDPLLQSNLTGMPVAVRISLRLALGPHKRPQSGRGASAFSTPTADLEEAGRQFMTFKTVVQLQLADLVSESTSTSGTGSTSNTSSQSSSTNSGRRQ